MCRPRHFLLLLLSVATACSESPTASTYEGDEAPAFDVVSGAAYADLTASLSAPDAPEADTDFDLTLDGTIIGGDAFSVHAYALWENATWSYNDVHMVAVTDGNLVAADGFGWGNTLSQAVTLNRPAGVYTFTLVFGQRTLGHGWYDVAVDLEVTVGGGGPALCDGAWLPPLTETTRAGRTVPLKFSITTCADGAFYADESVTALVTDDTGAEVAAWAYTGNPSTGISIDADKYHVNWDSDRSASGDYLVTVVFGTGDAMTRTITLR